LSHPKSSGAISDDGIRQLKAQIKALIARTDPQCSARAISCFPVPVFAQNDDGQVERRNRLLSCFNNWPMGFEERTISSIIEER
jgi:hypothetical protein